MKFSAIWQSKKPHEIPWIAEIFGDLIAEHVFDGNHEVALDDAILLDGSSSGFHTTTTENLRARMPFSCTSSTKPTKGATRDTITSGA